MRDPIAVTKEAVVVGASLLVVGSLLMAIDFKGKDHPAWPTSAHLLLDSLPIGFMKPLEQRVVL